MAAPLTVELPVCPVEDCQRIGALVVHKYRVDFGIGPVEMPGGATLLHVGTQPNAGPGESIYVWALVNPDRPLSMRKLGCFATGQPLPDCVEHVGTTVTPDGAFVWHVFEEVVF